MDHCCNKTTAKTRNPNAVLLSAGALRCWR